jgi:hypothetical protein
MFPLMVFSVKKKKKKCSTTSSCRNLHHTFIFEAHVLRNFIWRSYSPYSPVMMKNITINVKSTGPRNSYSVSYEIKFANLTLFGRPVSFLLCLFNFGSCLCNILQIIVLAVLSYKLQGVIDFFQLHTHYILMSSTFSCNACYLISDSCIILKYFCPEL